MAICALTCDNGQVTVNADLIVWLRAAMDARAERATKLLADAQQVSLQLQESRLLGREIPGWYHWPEVEGMAREVLADIDANRRILALLEQEVRSVPSNDEDRDWVQGIAAEAEHPGDLARSPVREPS